MDYVCPDRLNALPPYLFADIDLRKRAAVASGRDIIDFGVGDPDQPTPDFVVKKLQAAAKEPRHHRYPLGKGAVEFRQAAAGWFEQRFKVPLDPDSEVLALIGSKEGLGHLPLACLNQGDVTLIPSVGYPVYKSATIFAGGMPYEMPLSAATGWLPDFEAIPQDSAQAAKLMFLNYPNNPTGATADPEFFKHAVAFAAKHNILIAHDAAYSEITFDTSSPSILQVEGGKETAVEFYSLSKTFNMTGWRIGFAVGHPEALAALAKIKANMDSGQFGAIQIAAAEALNNADHAQVTAQINLYRERRDILVEGLNKLGFTVRKPAATFYVWMPVPKEYDSLSFASRLLDEADVVVVPGEGFGPAGQGYVRFALTVSKQSIAEALDRISRVQF